MRFSSPHCTLLDIHQKRRKTRKAFLPTVCVHACTYALLRKSWKVRMDPGSNPREDRIISFRLIVTNTCRLEGCTLQGIYIVIHTSTAKGSCCCTGLHIVSIYIQL